jgi:competence protein ComGC
MHGNGRAKPRINWIEIAIVGVLLVVLAALAVPQFTEAGMDPRETELRAAVQIVQGQIEMYRLQHENQYPTLTLFAEQMTQPTNSRGETGPAGTGGADCGPYLKCVPVNPYKGTNDVSGDRGSSAWFYNETTGEFRSNHVGAR